MPDDAEEKVLDALSKIIWYPCSVLVTGNDSERGYAFKVENDLKVSVDSLKSLIYAIRSYYAED